MEKIVQKILGVAGVSLVMACQAAPSLQLGQAATPEQLAQWGELQSYELGSSRLRLIPGRPEDGQGTYLLNAQGVVGISRNELTVAHATEEQVRTAAAQAGPAPVSMQYFEPTGTTVLRYADFQQAVQSLEALKTSLPKATVRLPVQFSKPVPY